MASRALRDRIAVCYITRSKGVRGEVKAQTLTHNLARFDSLDRVVIRRKGHPDEAFRLESWHPEGLGVRLKFEGIDSPEEARERLVNSYVTVGPDEVAALPDDMYYVFELEGCSVYDENGQCIGRIAEVLQMPSTDVYVLRGDRGELLIPAVADFIVEVDISAQRLLVRGIEALLPPT